jgi:membrane associated rhomboid family serine protease
MRRPRLEIPERLQRLPLLSVSIVVLWVMATAVVELLWAPLLRTVEGDLQAAVEFAIRNPVVEVDARLLPAVRAVMPEFESNEMFAFLRRTPAQGGGASPQERFDALAAQAFASLDAHPHRVLGLVPRAPQAHSFIGHLLVHASWTHLLATVLIWLLVAPLLERLWGAGVLAGSVLLLGAAGGAVFFLAHSDADRALLGGSAVVAGLVSAVVVRFRNAEVDFLGWLSPWVKAELQAPAWTLALVWAGYEALLWWTVQGALPGGVDDAVGYAAHAAAVGLGALLPLAYSGLGWEERFGRGVSSVRGRGEEARFDFQRVLNLRARGDHDRAFALLRAEVERSARHRDAVTTFWEMCIERGDPQQAAPAMARLVREELRRGADEVAVAHWREVSEHLDAPGIDPATLARLLPAILRVDGQENALVALQQALDPRVRGLSAGTAAQLARLAEPLDRGLAQRAARLALSSDALDEATRVQLRELAPEQPSPEDADDPAAAETEKDEPSPSIFYLESDRSAFGEVSDLSELQQQFPDGAVTEAVPCAVDAEGIQLARDDGEALSFAWTRVRAVSVAGVRGLGPKPVILIDLLVDGGGTELPLRAVRCRSDRFDPRRLAPETGSPLDALRSLVQRILEQSGGLALPDPQAVMARPVKMFDGVDAYQDEVLRPAGRELG